MFDWVGDFPLRHRVIHFLFCNNWLFPGCSGHPTKEPW